MVIWTFYAASSTLRCCVWLQWSYFYTKVYVNTSVGEDAQLWEDMLKVSSEGLIGKYYRI